MEKPQNRLLNEAFAVALAAHTELASETAKTVKVRPSEGDEGGIDRPYAAGAKQSVSMCV